MGRDGLAGAAPGGHAVDDHEAGGLEGGVEVGFAVGEEGGFSGFLVWRCWGLGYFGMGEDGGR